MKPKHLRWTDSYAGNLYDELSDQVANAVSKACKGKTDVDEDEWVRIRDEAFDQVRCFQKVRVFLLREFTEPNPEYQP